MSELVLHLTPEEQRALEQVARGRGQEPAEWARSLITERLAATSGAAKSPSAARQPRVAGLHAGTIWTSEDFDAPLPDEFWLGKE